MTPLSAAPQDERPVRLLDRAQEALGQNAESIRTVITELESKGISPAKFYAKIDETNQVIKIYLTDETDLNSVAIGGGRGDSQVCEYNKKEQKLISCLYFQ